MQRRLRLRLERDFARLRYEGHVCQNRWMVLSVAPNALEHNRYGFITGRSLGKAVARNRVRRLMREAVWLLHPRLRTGFDIVLIGRSALVGQPFSAVQQVVAELCDRAGVLMGESEPS